MNQRELREIRRRFSLESANISHIYGCYVNAAGEIVADIDMSVGLMEQEEAEMYLKVLKKSISGTLGRNLLDIAFTMNQVENSDEHRLLQALRKSQLKDENMRKLLYDRIIENLEFGDESYVILLGADSYDVPYKGNDDEIFDEGSSEVFDYVVCGICPVKDAKAALRYRSEEKAFRNASTGHVIGNPEIGFMFPAFDNRSANIHNALYYSRNTSEIHEEFIKAIFNTDSEVMSPAAQKNAFSGALTEALGEHLSLEVVQAVHGEIRERLEMHKEAKEVELPEIYVEDVSDILRKNGIPDENINSFSNTCEEEFGNSGVLNPANLMETKKFEMVTPEVKVAVDPEYAASIRTKVIDGVEYLLIPVSEGLTVNGIDISLGEDEE